MRVCWRGACLLAPLCTPPMWLAACSSLPACACVGAAECIGSPSAWDGAGSPQPCRRCAGGRMYLRRRNARAVNPTPACLFDMSTLRHALPRTGNAVRATAAHVRCCCRSDRPCGSAACRSGAAFHPIAHIGVSHGSTVYRRPDIAAPLQRCEPCSDRRAQRVCVCWCVCVCVRVRVCESRSKADVGAPVERVSRPARRPTGSAHPRALEAAQRLQRSWSFPAGPPMRTLHDGAARAGGPVQ